MRTIRIGTRESRLAVEQARLLQRSLEQRGIGAELVTMKTTGDKILDRTLEQIGGKGLFVRELDQALRDGRADFTVHSLKDMPMETPEDLPLAAFSGRADPRDCLVLPAGVTQWDRSKPVGCASKRRELQLKALYPDLTVLPVRGNVQTRLRKLDSGEYGALVLAAAGLKRLGLEGRIARYFEPTELLPAAGQGILAVQTRRGMDTAVLDAVRDEAGTCCALAERAFVRALGGGCTSPVAAYATVDGDTLTLTGLYVSPDETVVKKETRTGPKAQAEALGAALAREMGGLEP